MRIGEFDPKAKVPYAHTEPGVVNSPGHVALAEEIATKTPVLLKNNIVAKTNEKALPLKADNIRKIALIGPQADRVELGPYSGNTIESNMITPLSGIKTILEDKGSEAEVVFSTGANTLNRSNLFNIYWFEMVKTDGSSERFDATKFSSSARGITVGSGLTPEKSVKNINDGDWTSYENIDVSNLETIDINLSVPGDGGAIEIRLGSVTGNLLASFEVTEGQGIMSALMASSISAKVNKLDVTGNQTIFLVYRGPAIAPVDEETLAMASSSDVAIVFVGTDDRTANEEADRLTLLLPGNQYELIKTIAGVNPNTIVMQTMGAVEVEQFKDLPNIPGIVWTGFNGQAQGAAMARILFGDVNPGGKLNATWYKSVEDLPPITDYEIRGGENKNGRTYWYFKKDVSYEFGYGLSYTTFEYSNAEISKSTITPNDKVTVSVDVRNTGDVDGDEVVQVYMRTPDSPASLERPVKRLKGFQRVTITAGQTRKVDIEIDCEDLWFWDDKMNRITFDQGKYLFEIGSSSKDIRGVVEATMSGTYNPILKTVVAECGKVVLKQGNTVQTSVTAAMSDDSFYDISKAQVTYTSNNPQVAIVNEKGVVTANGAGTASITAYVTVEGNTLSDSYPVKVMPDLTLSNITVNGKRIDGFNPETYSYSYLWRSPSKAPVVKVNPSGTDISINTVQAKSVPGTSLITLTDNVTGERNIYSVNFGTESASDEFNSQTLGKQWKWIRENPENWSLSKTQGALTITSKKGDIMGASNNAENILVQSANTDWTIETKMAVSKRPTLINQQGGLIAYQDDDNYVKLVYDNALKSFMGSENYIELIVESNGAQYSAANIKTAGLIQDNLSVVLKLEKKGNIFTAYYSLNEKDFVLLGSTESVLADVYAGLLACDGAYLGGNTMNDMIAQMMSMMSAPDESEFEVQYDYFHISNSGLK